VIAHRLSTVREADEIIVLTEEGIAQRGTHDELISRSGLYRDLYSTQTELEDEDEPETEADA
jgi:ATP-binding cassette subfamily B protein